MGHIRLPLIVLSIAAFVTSVDVLSQVEFGTLRSQSLGSRNGYPSIVRSGSTVWIRSALDETRWLYLAIDYGLLAISPNLSDSARINRDGRFSIVMPGSQSPIQSGSYVQLLSDTHQLVADPVISTRRVRLYGPPRSKAPEHLFYIVKVSGSADAILRFGDRFKIRGTRHDYWLSTSCPDLRGQVCILQNEKRASLWVFADAPPANRSAGQSGFRGPTPPPVPVPAVPAPSRPSSQSGRTYICTGTTDLNFAGCTGRYVYACNSTNSAANVTVTYQDADGAFTTTREMSVTVPANATIGHGAVELPGGSNFASYSFGTSAVCRTRNFAIVR